VFAAGELLDPCVRRGLWSIDWLLRIGGRASINPAEENDGTAAMLRAAVIVFVIAYAAAIPFMNTSLIEGPVARAVARPPTSRMYSWNLLVAALLLRRFYPGGAGAVSTAIGGLTRGADESRRSAQPLRSAVST